MLLADSSQQFFNIIAILSRSFPWESLGIPERWSISPGVFHRKLSEFLARFFSRSIDTIVPREIFPKIFSFDFLQGLSPDCYMSFFQDIYQMLLQDFFLDFTENIIRNFFRVFSQIFEIFPKISTGIIPQISLTEVPFKRSFTFFPVLLSDTHKGFLPKLLQLFIQVITLNIHLMFLLWCFKKKSLEVKTEASLGTSLRILFPV